MAEIKTEMTMEEFVTKDRSDNYSGITRITVNGKHACELKGKFLDDLRDNAFSGTNGEDAFPVAEGSSETNYSEVYGETIRMFHTTYEHQLDAEMSRSDHSHKGYDNDITFHSLMLVRMPIKSAKVVTLVKQSQELEDCSITSFMDILKKHRNEVTEIRAEMTSTFAKPEFLKKAQRANPRLYDIGCYNDNLALMLAPDSDETIRLEKERRSKLSDLIRPFDYDQLNNLYDFVKKDKTWKNLSKKISKRNSERTGEQSFEIQDFESSITDKGIAIRVIPNTSVSRPQLKSNHLEDRVMSNNSQGKKQEVEDHRLDNNVRAKDKKDKKKKNQSKTDKERKRQEKE
ncbi:hypothetical protein Tco_0829974 [Tanacetum coccineum]